MTNAGSGWPLALLASLLIGVTSMVADASTTTRAPTPTMAADQIWGDPGYAQRYIYGNLFDIAGQTDATLAFYGGDSGTIANYRQGTLFF